MAGVEIARVEGGRAVTLARVAEACGVSKPIAYRLFDSLADLLMQMERRVVAEYEAVVARALEVAQASGASRRELLEALARSYFDHSLGDGAVYDTVSAAHAATVDAEEHYFELPESFLQLGREVLGLPVGSEAALVVMFQGAADNLVAAVVAGVLEQAAAVDHLVALFAPQLPAQPIAGADA